MAIIGLFERLGKAVGGWFSKNAGPAFAIAGATIVWFWNNISKPSLAAFMALLGALAVMVVAVFKNIIVPTVKIVVSAIKELWKTIVALYQATKPVWNLLGVIIMATLKAIGAAMKWLLGYIVEAWQGIKGSSGGTSNFLAMMFNAIIVGLKAIGVIAMWLWQNIFVPAFAGIRIVIQVLGVIIAAIFAIVYYTFKAIGAVVMWLWQNVFSPAISAIVAIVKALISVFVWLWTTFGPIIIAVGKLIWAIVNFVIVLAFNLIKIAVLALVVVAIAAFVWIRTGFTILGAIIMWVWNTFLKPAIDGFMAIVAMLWSVVSPYVQQIGAWFSEYLGPVIGAVVSGVVSFFTWLWSMIVSIWNGIVGAISSAVDFINGLASGISNFVNKVVGFFTGLVDSISGAINSVTSKISSISGSITGALVNAGTWLYDAGKSIIQGLINGLDSMWQSLKNKASEIAGSIRDFFPFSPAKTGPLSGSGSPEIAGGKIVNMVSDGMTAQIPDLRMVTGNVASALQLGVDQMVIPSLVTGPIPVAATAATAAGNSYYLTVNALDPKSAARAVMDSIGEWERSNGKGWRKP
jgi:phage-related protein